MKKIIAFYLPFFLTVSLFSKSYINDDYIVAYRNAVTCFENNEYGKALKFAEDAILYKNNRIAEETSILEKSFSSRDVKRAGDKITSVIPVLEYRDEKDCISIINYYVEIKSIDFYKNSITNLLNYIKSLAAYPEAEKIIGDVYKLEGEYDFAEEYYTQALNNKDVLDIPAEQYTILYDLAEISRLKNDENRMEIRLLNIIDEKQVRKNKQISSSVNKLFQRKQEKQKLTKLLTMYESEGYYYLNAYNKLAEYYYSKEEYSKAFDYSLISIVTSFTKIESILKARDMDYQFKDLQTFLADIEHHGDIIRWGNENNVWKNYNDFARICGKLNYSDVWFELLTILSQSSPEKYWQQEAVLQLDIADGIN